MEEHVLMLAAVVNPCEETPAAIRLRDALLLDSLSLSDEDTHARADDGSKPVLV